MKLEDGFVDTTLAGNIWVWTVHGIPKAQGRPRFVRRGKFVGTYDPETSADWKRSVQAQVIRTRPPAPLIGALRLTLVFNLPRPKSLPRRITWHVRKPDLDNLVKAIEDALTGIVYVDDSQIVSLDVSKRYDESPGVSIRVCQFVPIEEPRRGKP